MTASIASTAALILAAGCLTAVAWIALVRTWGRRLGATRRDHERDAWTITGIAFALFLVNPPPVWPLWAATCGISALTAVAEHKTTRR